MHADLVRAPGHGLGRDPGEFLARLAHHRIVGERGLARLPSRARPPSCARRGHAGRSRLPWRARALIVPCAFFGTPLRQRPVDLARVALLQRFARSAAAAVRRARDDAARREVSRSRRCTSRGRVRFSKASWSSIPSTCFVRPEPPCVARPGGLFSTMTALVHIEDRVFQAARVLGTGAGRGLSPGRHASICGGRRTVCPDVDAVGGLHALAVEPHLSLAQHLLQPAMGERRIVPLEPAVDADAVFVVGDAGFGHVRARG